MRTVLCCICLQCFDTVGWAAGKVHLVCKKWGTVEVGTG